MIFQQIRNATVKINYAGKIFLIDPWLIAKGTGPIFLSILPEMKTVPSPLVDLPIAVEQVLADVDAVIITHDHADHFDDQTAGLLDKKMKLFVQNEIDAAHMKQLGFQNVDVLNAAGTLFEGIVLTKTPGMHGETPEKAAGEVCGVVFQHPDEKTLYVAGDTIWYIAVERTIQDFQPEVIVLNCCKAYSEKFGRLIMDEQDVYQVCLAAPQAIIIASHMETVNHALLTRDQLKNAMAEKHFTADLRIPLDGEGMEL